MTLDAAIEYLSGLRQMSTTPDAMHATIVPGKEIGRYDIVRAAQAGRGFLEVSH